MFHKLLLSALVLTAGSNAALAQGFSGAEIGLEYTDSPDLEDLGGVSYYGSAEFEAAYGISVAIDATGYNYDVGISDVSNITGHVIYNIDAATAIGGFIGQDNAGDGSSDVIGAEVAYDFGLGDVQAYVGSASDDAGDEVTIFGAAATYQLGNGFSFAGGVDRFSGDGVSASAVEVGGYYQLPQGPRFGAAIGSLGLEADGDDASEAYFALQASVAIGPNGGTTFGRRGAFEILKIGIEE